MEIPKENDFGSENRKDKRSALNSPSVLMSPVGRMPLKKVRPSSPLPLRVLNAQSVGDPNLDISAAETTMVNSEDREVEASLDNSAADTTFEGNTLSKAWGLKPTSRLFGASAVDPNMDSTALTDVDENLSSLDPATLPSVNGQFNISVASQDRNETVTDTTNLMADLSLHEEAVDSEQSNNVGKNASEPDDFCSAQDSASGHSPICDGAAHEIETEDAPPLNMLLEMEKKRVSLAMVDPPSTPKSFAKYAEERIDEYSFIMNEKFCTSSEPELCENCYRMRVELEKISKQCESLMVGHCEGKCVAYDDVRNVVLEATQEIKEKLADVQKELERVNSERGQLLDENISIKLALTKAEETKNYATKDLDDYKFFMEQEVKKVKEENLSLKAQNAALSAASEEKRSLEEELEGLRGLTEIVAELKEKLTEAEEEKEFYLNKMVQLEENSLSVEDAASLREIIRQREAELAECRHFGEEREKFLEQEIQNLTEVANGRAEEVEALKDEAVQYRLDFEVESLQLREALAVSKANAEDEAKRFEEKLRDAEKRAESKAALKIKEVEEEKDTIFRELRELKESTVPQKEFEDLRREVSCYEAKVHELEEELALVKTAAEQRESSLLQEHEYMKTKSENETLKVTKLEVEKVGLLEELNAIKANSVARDEFLALHQQFSDVEAEAQKLREVLNSSKREAEMQARIYEEKLEGARSSAEAQTKIYEQKLENAKQLAELRGAAKKEEYEAAMKQLTGELSDIKANSMQREDGVLLQQQIANTGAELRQAVEQVRESNENVKLLQSKFGEVEKMGNVLEKEASAHVEILKKVSDSTELLEKVHQLLALNKETENERMKMLCYEIREMKEAFGTRDSSVAVKAGHQKPPGDHSAKLKGAEKESEDSVKDELTKKIAFLESDVERLGRCCDEADEEIATLKQENYDLRYKLATMEVAKEGLSSDEVARRVGDVQLVKKPSEERETKVEAPHSAAKAPGSQRTPCSAKKSKTKGSTPGRSGGEQPSCRQQ